MSTITQIGDDCFYPSDDKMVDVWLELHKTVPNNYFDPERLSPAQDLYFTLTGLLLRRAKELAHPKHAIEQNYGSLERA